MDRQLEACEPRFYISFEDLAKKATVSSFTNFWTSCHVIDV